jgi:hypothetical protein
LKERRTAQDTRYRGTPRVGWMFTLAAAYDLIRLPKLLDAAA